MNSKIRDHIRKYKWVYITSGVILLAGSTWLIMRSTNTKLVLMLSAKDSIGDTLAVQKTPLETHGSYIFKNSIANFGEMNNSTVSVIERTGRGHPGYLTRCLETNTLFKSQRAAADALNLNPAQLSDHINGLREHVNGYHFERLYLAE